MNRTTLRSLLALLLTAGVWGAAAAAPREDITAFLRSYDAAFGAKDLERLAGFYHPDVTIFEGGKVVPHLLGDGRSAYVTAEYRLKAKMGRDAVIVGGDPTWWPWLVTPAPIITSASPPR
jgi:hypothetical protein